MSHRKTSIDVVESGRKPTRDRRKTLLAVVLFLASTGCRTAADHTASLPSAKEREFTLGLVQKEIRIGMAQTDVVTALGSPNILTRDADGNESWVYDKIATEASYSKSTSIVGGNPSAANAAATLFLGLVAGGSQSSGASSSTQKTLTVIIKFDTNALVQSFSFHASKF